MDTRQRIVKWAKSLTHEQAIEALVQLTEYAIDSEMVSISYENEIPYWDRSGEPVVAGQSPFEEYDEQ